MKVIGKELRKEYCGGIFIGYTPICILDKLPKEREYVVIGDKKGYVVSINYNEEEQCYWVYLEEHLDDYNNQINEICNIASVTLNRREK